MSWPHQVGVLPRQAHSFQDRSAGLALTASLASEGTAGSCHVLTGMGGVGKTQLAAHYARGVMQAGESDLLVWVTATTRSAVIDTYAQAAADILDASATDPEAAATAFLAWLEPKTLTRPSSGVATEQGRPDNPRWLVVLDDVADPADLRGLWPPNSPHGHTVVTSRRRDLMQARPDSRPLSIELFTPDEAVAYLTAVLAAHARTEPADQLAGLAADIGYLPLVLSQAAAYLVDAGLGCAAYRTLLADRSTALTEILPETAALPDDQTTQAVATWSLSIDRANLTRPAGLAQPMLQLASMLDPNGIPSTLLTGEPALDHLTARRTHCPSPEAATAVVTPKTLRRLRKKARPEATETKATADEALGALKALHRLSLIELAPETEPPMVHVHQIIQRTVRDILPREQYEQLARTAADSLMAVWPGVEHEVRLEQTLRANANSLTSHSGDALWQRRHPHPVIQRVADSLRSAGQPTAAMTHYQHLADSAVEHYGKYDLHALSARHAHALCQGEAGDAIGAIAELGAVLQDFHRVLEPFHPAVLAAEGDLAQWWGEGGDAAEAVSALENVLPNQVGVLGPHHPDTLISWARLAHWRGMAGDASYAAGTFMEVLANQMRVLPADHSDTLVTRQKLATWCGRVGDAAGSATALEGILSDCLRVLGAEHPTTLRTRQALARCRGEAGDAAKAATAFESLVDDCSRALGPDSPDTLTARQNLAYWRAAVGDRAGATTAFEALVKDCHRALGPESPRILTARHNPALNTFLEVLANQMRGLPADHPDTLATRRKLAAWWGRAGDAAGAATALEGVLSDCLQVLGQDHPTTLKTRQSLARCRGKTGDAAGAATAFETLVNDCSRALGPDSPDTLTARENLAYWRAAAGDRAAATTACEALVKSCQRALGPDSPRTLKARHDLALCHGKAGDAAGAATALHVLLADCAHTLGRYHPKTLKIRQSYINWDRRASGGAPIAPTQPWRMPDPQGLHALATRATAAYWNRVTGNAAGAVTVLEELLEDQRQLEELLEDQRQRGAHHYTLATRGSLAHWRGVAGDAAGAAVDFGELLGESISRLGPGHPHSVGTRACHAYWLDVAAKEPDDLAHAYAQQLEWRLRRLGPNHPRTLASRANLAYWRGMAGDTAGAVAAFEELLDEQLQVLGPDHPDTAITQQHIDYWRAHPAGPSLQ
ncbi:tetratricopeptide repeat protein [Streptomyces sp. NPDC046876]|uniref:tetratricopeptide repeat protein n=1 Tax=Streptomyces sp. NPDC046876 TaxID=3155616 RepID=UPI0033C18E42